MKTRKTITRPIAITLTVAAMAVAFLLSGAGWLQPVEAQTGDGSVKFVSYQTIGIVHGQKIRFSVGNSVGNTKDSAGTMSLSFSYYLAHGSNSLSRSPLHESELISVPPGEVRFSDLSRKDLNTEGEPETGRVQLIVIATIIAPAGSNPAHFPGWLEVINELTGATTAVTSKRIWEYTACCDPTY